MKTLMSYDGLEKVDVPIEQAIQKAKNTEDAYMLHQLEIVLSEIKKRNRITKANLDMVEVYLNG